MFAAFATRDPVLDNPREYVWIGFSDPDLLVVQKEVEQRWKDDDDEVRGADDIEINKLVLRGDGRKLALLGNVRTTRICESDNGYYDEVAMEWRKAWGKPVLRRTVLDTTWVPFPIPKRRDEMSEMELLNLGLKHTMVRSMARIFELQFERAGRLVDVKDVT